tara:strand:- start:68 stop:739 length:672 start_codon:yes stop_codon:yes gene_type:complete
MTNFIKMRKNMISGQFLPAMIKNDKILDAFSETPREKFLADRYKSLSYSDKNIKIKENRHLISPLNYAKMLQAAQIQNKEVILLIGAGLGYETLILSKISGTVVALEEDEIFFNEAEKNLKVYELDNVINVNGKHHLGYAKHSLYDKIILLGSTNKIESILFDQLALNGMLVVCQTINEEVEEGKLYIYYNIKNNIIKKELFDLNLPKLFNIEIKSSTFCLDN